MESGENIRAKAEDEKYKYHFSEVEELRDPIKKILDQLRDEIDSGRYKVILGDDASGRIPTIVFGNILKSIYSKKGFEAPEIKFIPASYYIPKNGLDKRIDKIVSEAEMKMIDKVLIVTDTILSGNHLSPIAEASNEKGIKFDIASIGIESYGSNKNTAIKTVGELEKKWGHRIAWGMMGTPTIYRHKALSGVFKENEDLISRSRKRREIERWGVGYESKTQQSDVNLSREDAEHLSSEIYAWYTQSQY